MFITKEFIEKYSGRAKDIKVDGISVIDMDEQIIIALLAYFYEMYQMARRYMPNDEIS